ncbi:hypothetical protein BH20GEM1_BH20GEM1_20690 [soil metagenome]
MTTRLFLQSPSEALDAPVIATQMPEFERLGERALLLARPGDVVGLAGEVDARYLRFLEALGIGPRGEDIVVIDGVRPGVGLSARLARDPNAMERVLRRLRGAEAVVVCPFFTTPDASAVGRAIGRRLRRPVRVEGGPSRLARRLHHKAAARALAESLGVPVAPGEVVRLAPRTGGAGPDVSALARAIDRWSTSTGHVIVRGSSSASGSSLFTSRSLDRDAMIEAIAARTDNSDYLVEPLFEATASPNVEVVVEPGPSLPRVGVTEQVLDRGLVYTGSIHPSPATRARHMVEDARAIAAWMRGRRFTGRAGFDFVEHETGGRPQHFLTEINPRINGASYPLALLGRLAGLALGRAAPVPAAFRTGYVKVRTSDFGELTALSGPLLYDPARGEGIVFYSPGALRFGKVGLAVLGATREAAENLRERFVERVGAHPAPIPARVS